MRREWEAELAAQRQRGGEAGLAREALGAFADARALRHLENERGDREGLDMGEWLARLGADVRLAVRGLGRSPGFTAVAVLTLALGLGGSGAVYTLLERVVLDPLPYPESGRLVRLMNEVPGVGPGERWHMSTAQYVHLTDHARALESVGLYRTFGTNVLTPSGPERVTRADATWTLLPLLGGRARVGRLLTADDDRPRAPLVGVLSHGFWERALGADPGIVGRALSLSDVPVEIVGVLDPGLELPGMPPAYHPDVWLPMRIDRGGTFGNTHIFGMIGRLAPEVDPATAEAELARLEAGLPAAFPDAYSQAFFDRYGFRTVVLPLKEDVVGDLARSLWILLGAVGLVLLVACANVANLFLVRMEGRRRELAVRRALGAGRGALARYLLVEGTVLALAGGGVAVLVLWWGVPALTALAPDNLPRMREVGMGPGSLLLVGALALVIGIALAAWPVAVHAAPGAAEGLADGGRGGSEGRKRQRVRSALVVAQVALALVLVVGAGLLVESLRAQRRVDPGFEPAGVLTAQLHLSPGRHPDHLALWRFYDELLGRIRALPGVVAAGLGEEVPVAGSFGCTVQGFEDGSVYARTEAAGRTTCAGQVRVTPGYFEALGIPLLEGRLLDDADLDEPSRAAVVVSRAFADRFWPGEDPLGMGVSPARSTPPFHRVIGVVGDVPAGSVVGETAVAIYYPVAHPPLESGPVRFWWPGSMTLVVATAGDDPAALVPALRRVVAELDPEAPLADPRVMEAVVSDSMSRLAFTSLLLGIAAGTALLLAAVGLYGVLAWVVSRRTREIGMRLAIGARPGEVQRLFVVRAMALTGTGLVAGLVVAAATAGVMESLLFGVEPTQPRTYLAASAVLAGVALVAAWLPARRAARMDPAEALRRE